LLTFFGDRLLGFFLKKITEKSQFRYSRLYHSKDTADILFIGNSRGLSFYQPEVERLTNLKTLNLSYNALPADLAKALILDYLEKHIPPKMLIVDITLCDRYNEILKAGFNLYTPYSARLTDLIKTSATVRHKSPADVEVDTTDAYAGAKVYYGGKLSHLFRYNSEIFQRALIYKNKIDNDWLIDRVISQHDKDNENELKSYTVRMIPSMVSHLKDMIHHAKEKGVEVKLVINPYYPPFAESIRDSFLNPLKTYVEHETGLPVSDFSTILQAREEIGDYQHANKKGSIRYMQILTAEGFFGSGNMGYGQEVTYAESLNDSPILKHNSKFTSNLQVASTPSVKKASKRIFKPHKRKSAYEDEVWYSIDTLFSN
jgi:hypothetical protein